MLSPSFPPIPVFQLYVSLLYVLLPTTACIVVLFSSLHLDHRYQDCPLLFATYIVYYHLTLLLTPFPKPSHIPSAIHVSVPDILEYWSTVQEGLILPLLHTQFHFPAY